jgi:hypothetical protein
MRPFKPLTPKPGAIALSRLTLPRLHDLTLGYDSHRPSITSTVW